MWKLLPWLMSVSATGRMISYQTATTAGSEIKGGGGGVPRLVLGKWQKSKASFIPLIVGRVWCST